MSAKSALLFIRERESAMAMGVPPITLEQLCEPKPRRQLKPSWDTPADERDELLRIWRQHYRRWQEIQAGDVFGFRWAEFSADFVSVGRNATDGKYREAFELHLQPGEKAWRGPGSVRGGTSTLMKMRVAMDLRDANLWSYRPTLAMRCRWNSDGIYRSLPRLTAVDQWVRTPRTVPFKLRPVDWGWVQVMERQRQLQAAMPPLRRSGIRRRSLAMP